MSIFLITLSMTAVILLLLLFEKLIGRKFSSRCRYILWTIIMLRLAIPVNIPIYTVTLPENTAAENLPSPDAAGWDPAGFPDSLSYPVPETSVIAPSVITETYPGIHVSAEEAPPPVTEVKRSLPDFREIGKMLASLPDSPVIRWIWLAGVVTFAASRLIAHAVYTRGLKRNRRLPDETVCEIYGKLAEKYGLRHPPALYVSDTVASPLLFGYFSPCILLPSCITGSNFADSNAAVVILSHELTHYRRSDLWIKLLCLAGESVHWFNPMVHLASRKCTQTMELSCDEAVLAGYREDVRQSYGNAMLDIVKRCRNSGEALTTHFNPRKNAVMERFANIIDMDRKRRGLLIIALVFLLCAAGCTVTLNRNGDDDGQAVDNPVENTSENGADNAAEELKDLKAQYDALMDQLSDSEEMNESLRMDLMDRLEQTEHLKHQLSEEMEQREMLEQQLQNTMQQNQQLMQELNRQTGEAEESEEVVMDPGPLRESYELWLNGMIPIDSLIEEEFIRIDMANHINSILAVIRRGENPMELLPAPPVTRNPAEGMDLSAVPDVTQDQIPSLFADSGGETPENGNCTHKFILPIDNKSYPNLYMDLYWSIGRFGESTQIYINHIDIYDINDRLTAAAPALLGRPDGQFHYITRLFSRNIWGAAGTDADGNLRIFYTPNNGDIFYPIDARIPDKTFDTAEVAAVRRKGAMEIQILVKLLSDGIPEYVSFDNYDSGSTYPYAFTYRGTVPYTELLNLVAGYPAFSDVGNFDFPNRNVPDGIRTADETEELDHLGLDPDDSRLRYIRALLSNDAQAVEALTYNPNPGEGMYAAYEHLNITEWLVQVDVYPGTASPRVLFSFRTYQSAVSAFSGGEWYTFIVQDGLYGNHLYGAEESYDGAAGAVAELLRHSYFEAVPPEMDAGAQWCLTEYICYQLTERSGKIFHTAAEITAWAKRIYGIENFVPAVTHLNYGESHFGTVREDLDPAAYNIAEMKEGDIYTCVPHGGISHAFRITDTTTVTGQDSSEAAVTVMFYADVSRTVESDVYRYTLREEDGEWIFTGCERLIESKYRPFVRGG